MGAEGTWSLAAAHPDRWAAIVPISGGGNTKIADKIKDIPCWCFHGDEDQGIPVGLSRDMVRSIKNAGGRLLYNECSGAGHDGNCWDRVYGNPDLYEWLSLQSRQ